MGGQLHAPAAFTPGKNPVPIVQEAGWSSEPVWTGAENLALSGIRSPDLPALSESLYRLSHPGSCFVLNIPNTMDMKKQDGLIWLRTGTGGGVS